MNATIQDLAVVVKNLEAQELAANEAGESWPDELYYQREVFSRILAGRVDQAVELKNALEQRIEDLNDALEKSHMVMKKIEEAFTQVVGTMPGEKLEGLLWNVVIQKNSRGSTIVEDEKALPAKYWHTDFSINARIASDQADEYRYWASVILRRPLTPEALANLTAEDQVKLGECMSKGYSKSAIEADLKVRPDAVPGAKLEFGKHVRYKKAKARAKEVAVASP